MKAWTIQRLSVPCGDQETEKRARPSLEQSC